MVNIISIAMDSVKHPTVITNNTHFGSNNWYKKEQDKRRKQLDLDGGERRMSLYSSGVA